jgi:outer membrane protein TolC
LSELKQQYLNAFVKLYKALGGGWFAEEEKTPDAQPGDAGNTPSI